MRAIFFAAIYWQQCMHLRKVKRKAEENHFY
jgi:hypothetical protein